MKVSFAFDFLCPLLLVLPICRIHDGREDSQTSRYLAMAGNLTPRGVPSSGAHPFDGSTRRYTPPGRRTRVISSTKDG